MPSPTSHEIPGSSPDDGDRPSPGLDPARICTLPSDGLAERLAWIRREILPHAVGVTRRERGLSLELVDAPGLAAKLDRLAELERACCSGIVLERMAGSAPGRLALVIGGIEPDAEVFRVLEAGVPRAGRPGRLARAAGLGALASLLVCCALPVAAAALLGAAAAPLAALDAPGPLAAGALLGAGVAWGWLGRRARRGPRAEGDAPGCGSGC